MQDEAFVREMQSANGTIPPTHMSALPPPNLFSPLQPLQHPTSQQHVMQQMPHAADSLAWHPLHHAPPPTLPPLQMLSMQHMLGHSVAISGRAPSPVAGAPFSGGPLPQLHQLFLPAAHPYLHYPPPPPPPPALPLPNDMVQAKRQKV